VTACSVSIFFQSFVTLPAMFTHFNKIMHMLIELEKLFVQFLSQNMPEFTSLLTWPHNSPDLNSLDYDVWTSTPWTTMCGEFASVVSTAPEFTMLTT